MCSKGKYAELLTPNGRAALGLDESFDCHKQKNVLNMSKLRRSMSPIMATCGTPMISPINRNRGRLFGSEAASKSPIITPEPVQPERSPIFKKNPPKQVTSEKARRARRLTMFKVPKTPPPFVEKVKTTVFNSYDLNRPLCLNLILQDIGMMKYSELFIKEELNIPSFLTLRRVDMEALGIKDDADLQILLNAVREYQFMK